MYTKKIVCLANSRKLSGRCVAGKEWARNKPGQWIRPVSDRPSEEVSEYERQYPDGSDPKLLDVIEVPLIEPRPKDYQIENHLIEPSSYWTKIGRLSWGDLDALVDDVDSIWSNDESDTYWGLNDRIGLESARDMRGSLLFLKLESLEIHVFAPSANFGNQKRRVQARFEYNGIKYYMWVTDPVVEREYKAKPDGEYKLGECYVAISLGEPKDDYCYKLVAALITPDRA